MAYCRECSRQSAREYSRRQTERRRAARIAEAATGVAVPSVPRDRPPTVRDAIRDVIAHGDVAGKRARILTAERVAVVDLAAWMEYRAATMRLRAAIAAGDSDVPGGGQ